MAHYAKRLYILSYQTKPPSRENSKIYQNFRHKIHEMLNVYHSHRVDITGRTVSDSIAGLVWLRLLKKLSIISHKVVLFRLCH